MSSHSVSFAIPAKFVLSKDVEFEVKSDDVKLGTILISKGNIEWRPTVKVVKKHQLTWEKFAKLMEDEGKIVKAKK
jgi:hypothetical protein